MQNTRKKSANPKAPSNSQRWSDRDLRILKEMVEKGTSTHQIAIALGRTRASIWTRKSSMKLPNRLKSSRGLSDQVPATISSRSPRNSNLNQAKTKTQAVQLQEKKSVITINESSNVSLEYISKIAKATGAKITITFGQD